MMEAHTPRIPSQASRDAVMDPQTQQLALVTDASLFAENAYIVGRKDYSPDELQAMRGVYDAALLDLDKATGQLFAELDRRGVLDDTVVILVSDHGESLGEHRMMEHRWTIHEPLLHVPLVVRYPDALAPGRHTLPVSTTDVFATVLDLVGTDTPQDVGITAQSLRLLEGRGTVHAQLLDPFEEQMGSLRRAFKDLDLSPWRRTYCAIREGSLKYVTASDGQHALYDLATDPGEDANRLPADPDTAARLHAALHAWEAKLRPYDAANADAPSDEPVGEDERAQLVELGYIDEEDDGTTAVASVVGSCPR